MQQIVTVQKMVFAHVLVKKDLVCVDQTVHVVQMDHVNVQQIVTVQKMVFAHVLVKKDLVCVDQTVHVVIL